MPCAISLKSQKPKPQHREGGRREQILMRKESCSWLTSPCLGSVCFKNAPENFADKHGHRVRAGSIVRALNLTLRVC